MKALGNNAVCERCLKRGGRQAIAALLSLVKLNGRTMTESLKGKSVIVTGASKGIGKGIARVFAQAGGAKVLVVSRNLKEAEAAAKDFGNGASGFAADVTKPEDMAAMAKAA